MQKINIYCFYLLNIFFGLIPVAIILGNFATNLNIFILIVLTFLFFFSKKDKFKFNLNFFDKLILIFFLYTFITLLINYLEKKILNTSLSESIIVKTIFFQRYLIFYFLIRILLQKKILRLHWFNKIAASCAAFVCLDILIQFLFGKDLFGITSPSLRHYSGPFGNELIAGGYIKNFGLFILVFWQTLKKSSVFKKNYIFILLNIFILTCIIIAGNRMPLLLYLFSLILYSYFSKDFNKYLKKILLSSVLIFFIILQLNNNFKTHFESFTINGFKLITTTLFEDLKNEAHKGYSRPYQMEFYCSKEFIKKNPFFGGGIRSYRTNVETCGAHSHNYYLEILVDLGLAGLIIVLFIIFFISKKTNQLIKSKKALPLKMMPFLIVLITEFFPLKTSGSVFGTNNSIIIFTFLAILISQLSLKKIKKIKNYSNLRLNI